MSEETKDTKKPIPFYPDHFMTELRTVWWIVGIVILIGIMAFFHPVGLEEPANDMVTPEHVKPEWYFLGFYQLLKFIPKTAGVLLLVGFVLVLLVWPFFDRKSDTKRQFKIRLIGGLGFIIIYAALTIWGMVV
jgi:quinol-cytochrome oxidoreductase complex cytochrome b subunit